LDDKETKTVFLDWSRGGSLSLVSFSANTSLGPARGAITKINRGPREIALAALDLLAIDSSDVQIKAARSNLIGGRVSPCHVALVYDQFDSLCR
jgi:hypothetical protein